MIQFDPNSNKPKYQQLIDGIVQAIDLGELERGKQLPSINAVASEFSMARMTVTKAYDELRERGLITSHHGKGFYVVAEEIGHLARTSGAASKEIESMLHVSVDRARDQIKAV